MQLPLLPGAATPVFTTRAPLELWLRAGDVRLGGATAYANCFVIVEAGATLEVASDFGALFHAWSDGPIEWADGGKGKAGRPDLFGF